MAKNPEKFLRRLLRDNEIRKRIQNTMLVLSLFVVLGVFWSLKLTGITMAGEAFCGKEEHVHGEACPLGELVCPLQEAEPHTHSEICLLKELICEEEEREGHSHSEACYKKPLLCTDATVADHVHTSSCEKRTLICEEPEVPGHTHDAACRTRELSCTLDEVQGHSHEGGCFRQELSCSLAEDETHAHGDGCYTGRLVCEIPEAESHIHADGCYTERLICTQEELAGHTHGTDCYVLEEGYSCGLHAHVESCYGSEAVLICETEEDPGHAHDDACWYHGVGFGCGLTEAEGHIHTPECVTGETQIACGMEAGDGHTHVDECYVTLEQCPLEEHIHDENCYSDIKADLETEDDWEMSLAGLTRSIITADNVVAVATSQLGCGESTRNFQVDEFGVRRGITRYGQWYGNPYGDWSGMFASFCLYYGGAMDMPANAGPEAMRLEWVEADLYMSAAEFSPRYGDLLFLHLETEPVVTADVEAQESTEPGETAETTETTPQETYFRETPPANAVAIITGFDGEMIQVIQGDVDGVVAEVSYPAEDPAVLGYGLVPEGTAYSILVPRAGGVKPVAQTTNYDTNHFNNTSNRIVLYTTVNGVDYAIDGAGNAVPVYVENGRIYTELEDPTQLQWTFTRASGNNNWTIRNVATGRYLHAFYNSANDNGVTTTGSYNSNVTSNNGGALIRGNNNYYARLDVNTGKFVPTNNQSQAVRYKLGLSSTYTVWLDGTSGGQGQHGGSLNQKYTLSFGDTIVMPDEWQEPVKYGQRLRGWYDVTNSTYYAPGAEVTVTGNMVFYADWVAETYDVGIFTAETSNTVSTNSFITTHVFDYNYLFNVMSANPSISVSSSSHSETWQFVSKGNDVAYSDQNSLGFVFVDYDGSSRLPDMSGRNDWNNYHGVGVITQGIYSPELANILFNPNNALDPETGEGIIGKTYLGTGDHLFQFMDDPNDEHYGYYYYDSTRNAASYNQSQQRFYVYDYLEATSDSLNGDSKSDFLPFNSPYANTNGKTVRTYSYAGVDGEYNGTTHYRYDAKYSDSNNGTNYVHTNYASGMCIEVEFYLPNVPGERAADGSYGNKDFYGKDMHFKFSGDDDVWVLMDNTLVLDLGGIHGIENGDINFATGVVTINGARDNALTNALRNVQSGEHVLKIYYLERGSSQSNCAIYFNLAPRYSFKIQKEDVLTRDVLNGAQFSVYTDKDCTVPAQLWTSRASHDAKEPATNVFTVENGVANMWGMSAGQTYYIKETRKPNAEGYGLPNGIIELNFDMQGFITYQVHVIEEDGVLTPGFTVHGIKVDEETQSAFIVATNIQQIPNQEPTAVKVSKVWNDSKDHSGDFVTVYLTVTQPDGTVRRIREITLSQQIGWTYTWQNLPKYDANGNEILYGVQEATVPGYVAKVETVASSDSGGSGSSGGVTAGTAFENGQTYLLSTKFGYLTTDSSGVAFESSQQTAQNSKGAQWVATVHSNGTVTLVNKDGKTLYYDSYSFRASASPGANKNLNFSQNRLYCFLDHGGWSETQYPVDNDSVVSNTIYNHILYTTNNANEALQFTLMKLGSSTPPPAEPVEGSGNFRITNTPAGNNVTSLTVRKTWDTSGYGDSSMYESLTVQMRLLANGIDAGLSGELSLKNGWSYTFQNLPLYDTNGNTVQYSVEELPLSGKWQVHYGQVISSGGRNPTYSTTVTNTYRVGGPMLPSTGSPARMLYILCGFGIMLSSLVYGLIDRRMRERRRK